ncbi:restriction endonuclease subunit S [Alcaligenes sp. Lyrl_28]|uniref:restriction endonuclease subunit S n=1 Tax=Alcaligenes sp. Lyrl_28 TaxID=3110924 RepID=UPI003F7C5206
MDAQQFLAEFGHIANAPGGIGKLRELILQMAVQGRLIASTEADESTCVLLHEVRSIKADLVLDKKLPREKPFPEILKKETPVDSPPHWEWARFGELWQLLSGRDLEPSQYNDSNNGIPYITGASNLENGVINVNRWTSEPLVVSITGDLLVTCKGTIGKTAFNTLGEAHIARQIMAVRNFSEKLNTGFLKIWLDGFVSQLVEKSKSMIPGFSRDDLLLAPFPVVPIEEQSRIVAKVDELMALCDKLEAQQQARRKLQNNLRQSTLQAVASATSSYELQSTWTRLTDNFSRLFHAPGDVAAFKGLILDLAVSGELLNIKHRHAATGADLLNAIAEKRIEWSQGSEGQEQKEALAMLKKLRTQQVRIPEDPLPEHWAWASLLQVSQAVVDCHNKTAPYVGEGIHLIRTTDIRNGRMDLSSTRKISEETYAYWARRMPPKGGDIFFTREAPMGEAAIVPDGEKVCLGQRSMLIRLFPELFSNRFLLYVIQSPSFQTRMIEAAIGMTVKHLRVGGVEDLVVPVPPKAEQDEIVAIVDALFRMCDRYADQLSRKQRIAASLAASAVSSLTGIAIEQEEEPMKAPQTVLIAPLRLGTTPDIKAQAPLATILARHNGEMSAKDLWQRFGGEIDAFYAQLKAEVAHGWILEPAPAEMREKPADTVSA